MPMMGWRRPATTLQTGFIIDADGGAKQWLTPKQK